MWKHINSKARNSHLSLEYVFCFAFSNSNNNYISVENSFDERKTHRKWLAISHPYIPVADSSSNHVKRWSSIIIREKKTELWTHNVENLNQ